MSDQNLKASDSYLWDTKNQTIDVSRYNNALKEKIDRLSREAEIEKKMQEQHAKNTDWYQTYKKSAEFKNIVSEFNRELQHEQNMANYRKWKETTTPQTEFAKLIKQDQDELRGEGRYSELPNNNRKITL